MRSRGLGTRISPAFWKKAQDKPQAAQKQAGGRKRVIDRPELIELVRAFLMKHRKDTSRFAEQRLDARRRSALILLRVWRGGRA